ncbi:MAG TPA: DUF5076 domain-containing protein [Rhizomicrobium sp.]|nr:DUF5076 domain-containing protein [Rhizomicrobium sp.]
MANTELKQLPPPPAAIERGGNEILRAVIVDGGLQVSLQRAFDKPDVWGLLLADIARHVSRIYASEAGMSEAKTLQSVCEMFDSEMAKPTDTGTTQEMNRN